MLKSRAVLAAGNKVFIDLFRQAGCAVLELSGAQDEIEKIKDIDPAFIIFSQETFSKVKENFKDSFEDMPYIVFPMPGEKNLIEAEISELIKLAVGVEL